MSRSMNRHSENVINCGHARKIPPPSQSRKLSSLTPRHATQQRWLRSLRLSPNCATRRRSNGSDTAAGRCRSCPRTEPQGADLLAASLGQIHLSDIVGWPFLITGSCSPQSLNGRHATRLASNCARAFFPSRVAAAMLSKTTGEHSSGTDLPAR